MFSVGFLKRTQRWPPLLSMRTTCCFNVQVFDKARSIIACCSSTRLLNCVAAIVNKFESTCSEFTSSYSRTWCKTLKRWKQLCLRKTEPSQNKNRVRLELRRWRRSSRSNRMEISIKSKIKLLSWFLRVLMFLCWSLSKIWPLEAIQVSSETFWKKRWTLSSSWLITMYSEFKSKCLDCSSNSQELLKRWTSKWFTRPRMKMNKVTSAPLQIGSIEHFMNFSRKCTWARLTSLMTISVLCLRPSKVTIVSQDALPSSKDCFKWAFWTRQTSQLRRCWLLGRFWRLGKIWGLQYMAWTSIRNHLFLEKPSH